MQPALPQLPGLDGPDLFSTISGWPSPSFSALLNRPAVGCHVAWGKLSAGPFLQCRMVPRVQNSRLLAVRAGANAKLSLGEQLGSGPEKNGPEVCCHFSKPLLCSLASGKSFQLMGLSFLIC